MTFHCSFIILLYLLILLCQLELILCQFRVNQEYFENYCASSLKTSKYTSVSNTNGNICGFPIALNAYQVTFYTLEASFPFNAPPNLVRRAGQEFRSSIGAHAGIGVTLETNNGCSPNYIPTYKFNPKYKPMCEQFSIEFIAENYTEVLFNNNSASIYITNPLDKNRWINSKILTTTTGYVYTKYILQLLHNISIGYYDVYQPILVLQPNTTTFEKLIPVTETVLGYSGLMNYPRTSYSFLNESIAFLISKNCLVTPLLQLSSTYLIYFSADSSLGDPISLYDSNVQKWYADLYNCYKEVGKLSANAAFFFNNITICYDSYPYIAYVNVGNGSDMVYKVNLYTANTNISTPELFRFLLPAAESYYYLNGTSVATRIDIFIFCLLLLVLVLYCLFLTRNLARSKTSAIHKQMEGRFIDRIYETYGNDGYLKECNITLSSKPSSIISNRISNPQYRATRGNSNDDINLGLLNRGDTS